MRGRRMTRAAWSAGVLGGLVAQQPAWSQDAQPAASDALTEVVVTAQRRSENLQDVPIAVTVVQGDALNNTNFRGVTDLQYVVPSLTFDPNNGGGFQIRGVGTQSFDFSNEQGVSVVVDDVVMDAQRETGLFGLNDIDQVEVLRGPQGTLFGKNSTAGVIAITTKSPVLGQLAGEGSVSYGERNDRNVYGSLSIPLDSVLALRVSVFEQGQDGYGNYSLLDQKLGTYREAGTRLKLLFRPSDDLDVTLIADYSHHWDSNRQQATLISAATPQLAATAAASGAPVGVSNFNNADPVAGWTDVHDAGTSLHVNYRIGGQTLTSVTAFRYDGDRNNNPLDFVPAPLFLPINVQDLQTHKFSQEFRIASPTGGLFEYVAGVFYNDLKLWSTQLQLGELGAPLPPNVYLALSGASAGAPGNNLATFHNDNRGEAVFGQVKLNFSEPFAVIAGGRVTHDNNSAAVGNTTTTAYVPAGATLIPIEGTPVPSSGDATQTNFSYRISPQYRITTDTMVYFTWSTGYKGPGVAFVSGIYDPYKAETVKSGELGIKTELFEHRLRLNADVFDEHYKDFQAQVSETIDNLPQFVIGNAGGLTSKGVEADFNLRPIAAVTLNGGVTYDEAVFTDYVDGPNIYTGNTLTNAPRWVASLSGEYARPVGNGYQVTTNLNYNWRSQTYTNIGMESQTHVGGYGTLGGRLGFGADSGRWTFGVYGRNLTNRYYPTGFYVIGAVGVAQLYSPDAKRTVGAFVNASF
jgi:iron complex outermembrane receptor protein